MSDRIKGIRGANDVLPGETYAWRCFENMFAECLSSYGYQEIRTPIIENTQLFKRSIGEVTDIVEKEMYTFSDLNGDSLTLRPEGTVGCLRACLEHGLLYNQQQKLWYGGAMFRHERPQKGRYRQFHQFGVETFGIPGAGIELELISICKKLWQILGVSAHVSLQVNTLGTLQERQAYRQRLLEYLMPLVDTLDDDSKKRIHKNPLRILDSKNPAMADVLALAPKLIDSISEESRQHFLLFCQGLDALDIPYTMNPLLVRGLDYYGHTVFEWVTDKLGSQATVCAGGRYDSLVEQLGGTPTPAVGFALGVERLMLLRDALDLAAHAERSPDLFILVDDQVAMPKALLIAESLRASSFHWRVVVNTLGGGFKSQFKKADKSGARLALILGSDEINNQTISIKDLRQHIDQLTVPLNQLEEVVEAMLK